MKKPSFYQISAILAVISVVLFVFAVATDTQYEWLNMAVVISFIATFLSVPLLLLIGFIIKRTKKVE